MARSTLLLIGVMVVTSACATSRDSILIGFGTGALIGGAAGAVAGEGNHNEVRGAAIGAVTAGAFGALLGYLYHKREEDRLVVGDSSKTRDAVPSLTKPVVRRVWVPDKAEGDHLERGHWLYQIDRQSSWRGADDAPNE